MSPGSIGWHCLRDIGHIIKHKYVTSALFILVWLGYTGTSVMIIKLNVNVIYSLVIRNWTVLALTSMYLKGGFEQTWTVTCIVYIRQCNTIGYAEWVVL